MEILRKYQISSYGDPSIDIFQLSSEMESQRRLMEDSDS